MRQTLVLVRSAVHTCLRRILAGTAVLAAAALPLAGPTAQADVVRTSPVARSASGALVLTPGLAAQLPTSDRVYLEHFPLPDGTEVNLSLDPTALVEPGTVMEVAELDANGAVKVTETLEMPAIPAFVGRVDGQPDSRVFLAFPADGVVGAIRVKGRALRFSGGAAGVVMNDMVVEADDAPPILADLPLVPAMDSEDGGVAAGERVLRIGFEGDAEFASLFGVNPLTASTYTGDLIGLLGQVMVPDIAVVPRLHYFRLWKNSGAPNPFTAAGLNGAGGRLKQLWTLWNNAANRPTNPLTPCDVVLLLSGKVPTDAPKNPSNGGVPAALSPAVPNICSGTLTNFPLGAAMALKGTLPTVVTPPAAQTDTQDLVTVLRALGYCFGATTNSQCGTTGGTCTNPTNAPLMSLCFNCPVAAPTYGNMLLTYNGAITVPTCLTQISTGGLLAPSGVTATQGASATSITVNWSTVSGTTAYDVFRNEVQVAVAGGAVPVGTTTENVGANLGGPPFVDNGATASAPVVGRLYSYYVIAKAGSNASPPSNVGNGWLTVPAPTGVAATLNDTAKVVVSWTGVTIPGITGITYSVLRAQPGTSFVVIGQPTPPTATTFNDTTASPGVLYNYTVQAVLPQGPTSPPSSPAVNGVRACTPPTGVAATNGVFSDKTVVSWQPTSGGQAYRVFRRLSPAPFAQIAEVPGTQFSFDDTGGAPNLIYDYMVRAVFGGSLNLETTDSATAQGSRATIPAPTGVTASDNQLTGVVVSWVPSGSYTSMEVYRKPVAGTCPSASAAFYPPALPAGAVLIGTSTGTSFTDTTGASCTDFQYFVRPVQGLSFGPTSGCDVGSRGIAAPTGLTASDCTSTAGVVLAWTAPAGVPPGTITNWYIWRGTTLNNLALITTTPGAAVTFTDTTANPGTLYVYAVQPKAGASVCSSALSNTDTGVRKPTAPAAVNASDAISVSFVTIKFGAVTGVNAYSILRAQGGGPAVQVGTVLPPFPAGGNIVFNDTTGTPGVIYTYSAVSSGDGCDSTASGTDTGIRALPPPSSVTASWGTYTDKVRLTWNGIPGAALYRIQRKATGAAPGTFATVGTTAGTTFDDVPAAAQLFDYRIAVVDASNTNVLGLFSNIATGWRNVAAPTNLVATDGSSTANVGVSWTAVVGATPNSYKVLRSQNGLPPIQVGTVAPPAVTFNDVTAVPGSTYSYTVKAYFQATIGGGPVPIGDTAPSTADNGWRNVPAPTSVAATDGAAPQGSYVTWSPSSPATGVTGYQIYRMPMATPCPAAGAGIPGTAVLAGSVTGATSSFFQDSNAPVCPTTGVYFVVATSASGLSPNSTCDAGCRSAALTDEPGPTEGQAPIGQYSSAGAGPEGTAGDSAPEGVADAPPPAPETPHTLGGTLVVGGDLNLSAEDRMAFLLRDPAGSVLSDLVVVNGTFTVAGQLAAYLEEGYLPLEGDCHTVVAARRVAGVFHPMVLPSLPDGLTLVAVYEEDRVSLVALPSEPFILAGGADGILSLVDARSDAVVVPLTAAPGAAASAVADEPSPEAPAPAAAVRGKHTHYDVDALLLVMQACDPAWRGLRPDPDGNGAVDVDDIRWVLDHWGMPLDAAFLGGGTISTDGAAAPQPFPAGGVLPAGAPGSTAPATEPLTDPFEAEDPAGVPSQPE